MRRALLLLAPGLVPLLVPALALAWTLQPAPSPGGCAPAIARAERLWRLPGGILAAIATVESGRPDPDGRVRPWPWTLNAEGEGQFLTAKAEAVATVQALQAQGVRSIDVGCMQINLMHHPTAFPSLQEAFDPGRNAEYAASFLTQLRDQLGSWEAAIGAYHSATPALAAAYREKVLAAWHGGASTPGLPVAGLSGAGLPGAGLGMIRPFAPPTMGAHVAAPPSAAGGVTGRGLDAYRAAPIRLFFHR